MGFVPRAAARADLGERFLAFVMSKAGQTILAEKLRLPAVSLEVSDENSARTMEAALGAQLRPVGGPLRQEREQTVSDRHIEPPNSAAG